MKHKSLYISLGIALLITILFVPIRGAQAASTCTGGQNCWYKDAAVTTYTGTGPGQGTLCATGAVTAIYGIKGLELAGTNGTVRVELRYSSTCTSNWSRGTITFSNSNTKQLGEEASPTNSGYYATDFYYNAGNVLPAGVQRYTWMVDGTHVVYAYAGLNAANCLGGTDSHGNRTGFPCNYNPLVSYGG